MRRSASLQFLFAVTFLCQMLVGVVGIAVPIYADRLGASQFLIGLIGAAGGLTYSFMPLVAGVLCDKFSRKAFVSASLILFGVSCLLYSFFDSPIAFAFIRSLEWLSIAVFWPALEALLADSADTRLEETLRRFNVSWGSAMAIGPMVGGVLISGLSVKTPFLISSSILLVLGVLSVAIVAEPPRKSKGKGVSETRGTTVSRSSIVVGLASIFLFSSITGILLTLFPSYATDLGIQPFEIGLTAFAFGAARAFTFYQAYEIKAKLGGIAMFLLGSSTLALASLLTCKSTSVPMLTICFLVFGFGAGVSYAASISLILGIWSSSRGYAAGIFESLIGLGYFAGPLIGGFVSEYAPIAPFIYGFFLSLTVFFIQLLFNGKRSTSQAPSSR